MTKSRETARVLGGGGVEGGFGLRGPGGVVGSWVTDREAGGLIVRSGAVGETKSGFAQNKLSIESPSKSDNAGSGCQWRNWGLMRA